MIFYFHLFALYDPLYENLSIPEVNQMHVFLTRPSKSVYMWTLPVNDV